MSADQEKANLGCLPNGEPASSFKELAVFNVSNKKGSRKEYQKHVMDLVPGGKIPKICALQKCYSSAELLGRLCVCTTES